MIMKKRLTNLICKIGLQNSINTFILSNRLTKQFCQMRLQKSLGKANLSNGFTKCLDRMPRYCGKVSGRQPTQGGHPSPSRPRKGPGELEKLEQAGSWNRVGELESKLEAGAKTQAGVWRLEPK